ncbi:MAG: hypothetical protein WC683_16230 [bacterium]
MIMVNITNAVMTPNAFGRQFRTLMHDVPLFPVRMGKSGIVFGADEGAVIGNRVEPLVGIGGKRDFFKRVQGVMPAGEAKRDSQIFNAAARLDRIMDEELGDIFGKGFDRYLRDSSGAWATWQHLRIDGLFQARAIMRNYRDEFHTTGDFVLLSELAQSMLDVLPLNPVGVDPAKAAFVSGVLFNFSGIDGSAARAAQAFLLGAEYMSGSGDLIGSAMVEDIAAHVAEKGDLDGSVSMRRRAARQRRAASRWAGALEELRGRGHEADFEAALYRGLLSGWKGHQYEELERLYSKSAGFRGNAKTPDHGRAGEDRLRAAQVLMKMSEPPTVKDWAKMALHLGLAWEGLTKADAKGESAGIDLKMLRTLAKAAKSFSPGADDVPDLHDVP